MSVRQAATEFAEWSEQPVFPVKGKAPVAGFKWREWSSHHAEEIEAMPWGGGATGYGVALTGMVVVDIDDPADAEATAHWLGAQTLAVSTPQGGRHFYFTGDGPCANGLDHPSMGNVDLKSDGGYVVGPGSSGYRPAIDGPYDEPQISPMPDKLAKWVRTRSGGAKPKGGESGRPDDADLQNRLADAYRKLTGWHLHKGGAGQLQGPCPQCGEGENRLRIMGDGGVYCRKCPDGGKAAWLRIEDEAGLTGDELRFLGRIRDEAGPERPAWPPPGADAANNSVADAVPESLWDHCPALRDIWTVAKKRHRSPIGLLGAVLARLGASDTAGWKLPPVEGDLPGGAGTAPLHLFVFLASGSGGGKSTLVDLAKGIVDYPPPETDELGSGQGLFPAFGTYEEVEEVEIDGKTKKVRTGRWGIAHPRLLLEIDEGEKLMKATGQDGSSLMAYLRMAWGGKQISAKTAGRRDVVYAGSYTFGIVAAGTWKFAAQLLGDQGAGDAERWLLLPARDPEGLTVDEAGELERPGEIGLKPWPGEGGYIDVAESVARYRDDEQAKANINDEKVGHRTQNRLRCAALIAWLAGHPGIIDEDDFEVAGHLMDVSDDMKKRSKEEARQINRGEDVETGVRQGRRDAVRKQSRGALDRAGNRIRKLADKLIDDGVTAEDVRAAPNDKYVYGGTLTRWQNDMRAAGWDSERGRMVEALIAAMEALSAIRNASDLVEWPRKWDENDPLQQMLNA